LHAKIGKLTLLEVALTKAGIVERKAMIDRAHDLPVSQQAKVLRISRGSGYYKARPVPEVDLANMRRFDRLHLELPTAGSLMLRGLVGFYNQRRPGASLDGAAPDQVYFDPLPIRTAA
jgi:putative transposase